ncbi:MAG: hypothetical protein KKD64_11030 [Alphaproteobacteria bacterium]|nr:hypothetical protein [Alphaproteobacteria bacterium]MBU0793056.1 hypothetical protein [Alphaproteobacteria bacterium]MBU0877664.1 hypothetical protein [Alphaproteobacteria bacterium]MBU1770176.1 hypothetical protein [Alphaproteobacteria bacterium]
MNRILSVIAMAITTPVAAQAAEPTDATHAASAQTVQAMPWHGGMMADGKMKPDGKMMERCKKMHAAMVAKSGGAPDNK